MGIVAMLKLCVQQFEFVNICSTLNGRPFKLTVVVLMFFFQLSSHPRSNKGTHKRHSFSVFEERKYI